MLDNIQQSIQDLNDSQAFNNTVFRVMMILLLLLLFQVISHRLIDSAVERAVRRHKHTSRQEEHKREETLKNFFRTTLSVAVWTIGSAVILMQFKKINFTPLLTSAGVFGVIIGFGAQNLIKDCLAGIFIIVEDQLRVDDIVKIATPTATVAGMVEDVSIRTTRLRDLDGNVHIFTNGTIGVITNMSYHYAQVNVDIMVTYDTDIDLVEQLIKEAGQATAKNTKLKDDILEPIVLLRVDNLGESTVTLKALGKVKPGMQWDVAGEFRRQLKKQFDKNKIKAPYQNIVLREPETSRKK